MGQRESAIGQRPRFAAHGLCNHWWNVVVDACAQELCIYIYMYIYIREQEDDSSDSSVTSDSRDLAYLNL